MSSPSQRLLRTAIPPALEAEYEAAKAEYARSVSRLSAAKAAVTAELDQEAEKRRVGRLALEAAALAAWLGGASTRQICEIAGLKPAAAAVYAMLWHFPHALLTDEELYGEQWDMERGEDRERRLIVLALERYRGTISKRERAA